MVERRFDPVDDPFGCHDDLDAALTDPDLGSAGPAGAQAAYRAAVALGRCRLFGVVPGDKLSGPLPAPLAVAAATEASQLLTTWSEEADELSPRWEAAIDPSEADDLCGGLLALRMDAWAASTAINEAHDACLDNGSPATSALGAAIDRMQEALDRFDEKLEAQTELLATVTGTNLLDNWRALLAAPYKDDLPWWLDGRLEEAARRSEEEAAQTLPGPGFWEAVRRRSGRGLDEAPGLPPLTEGLLAAASTPGGALVVPGATYCWISPDNLWRAELILPAELTVQQLEVLRPLNFTRRSDDQPSSALAGEAVHLGQAAARTIDQEGKAWFRLAELQGTGGLRLRVGEPPQTWPYQPTGDSHAQDHRATGA